MIWPFALLLVSGPSVTAPAPRGPTVVITDPSGALTLTCRAREGHHQSRELACEVVGHLSVSLPVTVMSCAPQSGLSLVNPFDYPAVQAAVVEPPRPAPTGYDPNAVINPFDHEEPAEDSD
jgi:hypothetical protein